MDVCVPPTRCGAPGPGVQCLRPGPCDWHAVEVRALPRVQPLHRVLHDREAHSGARV